MHRGLFSSGSYLGNTNSDYSLLNNINYQIHQATPSEFGLQRQQIIDCDACDTYLRLCIKIQDLCMLFVIVYYCTIVLRVQLKDYLLTLSERMRIFGTERTKNKGTINAR